jgi:hypothetical protein
MRLEFIDFRLGLPPLSRRTIERLLPFPVSPQGDSATGGRPPAGQKRAPPADKRAFKTLLCPPFYFPETGIKGTAGLAGCGIFVTISEAHARIN